MSEEEKQDGRTDAEVNRELTAASAIAYGWISTMQPHRVHDGVVVLTREEADAAQAAAHRALERTDLLDGLGRTPPPECDTPRLIAAIDQALHEADEIVRTNARDAIRAPMPVRAAARARQDAAKLIAKPLKLALAGVDDAGPVRPTREELTAGIRAVLEYLDHVIETGGPPRPLAFKIARMLLRVQSGEEPL